MGKLHAGLFRDQAGGVFIEAAVMLIIMFVFVLGSVDFLFAMYHWNAAAKAVQHGARLASVSTPVDSTFLALDGLGSGINPGDVPPAAFSTRQCQGTSAVAGTCSNGTYSATNMGVLVFGRKSLGACSGIGPYCAGMNDFFDRIQPQNVRVTYTYAGLGFAGRVGGQVPSIEVTLVNLPFQFFFVGRLFPNAINISAVATATGEDISTAAPP